MSTGHADWQSDGNSRGVYSNDTNELAVRLKGHSRYSRSGKTLLDTNFCDDFDQWIRTLTSNVNAYPLATDGFVDTGCLQLTGAGTANQGSYFTKTIPSVLNSIYGFEFGFHGFSSDWIHPGLRLNVYDGVDAYNYDAYLDFSTNILKVPNASSVNKTLATLPSNIRPGNSFGVIKFYVDTVNHRFSKVQVGGNDLTLQDVTPLRTIGGGVNTDMEVGVYIHHATADALDGRFSHFIVTFGE